MHLLMAWARGNGGDSTYATTNYTVRSTAAGDSATTNNPEVIDEFDSKS